MKLKSVSVALTTLVFSFALLAANSGCEFSSTTSRSEGGPEAGSTTGGGTATAGGDSDEQRRVLIDGSSTVYPISQAVAEEFQGSHPNVKVVV